MPLTGGKYLVLNIGPDKHFLTLPKKDGGLTGAIRSGTNNQKWIIDDLDNGTYHISNLAYDTQRYATTSSNARGSRIDAKDTAQTWKITELDTGTYKISTANLAWSLGAEGITLQTSDKDDERQIWKFQPIP